MPINYPTGAIEEHLITRRGVGLFDIDHMGQIEIAGEAAETFVSHMISAKVSDLVAPMARYSLLLNEKGGIIDDLFVYRLPNSWWIVVNASNRAVDLEWFRSKAPTNVSIIDRSDDTYMIAVQGPRAIELLDKISNTPVSPIPRFCWANISIEGIPILFGRTGYTGEKAIELWEYLLECGESFGIETKPIGLAARDSLRFEAGLPLHGHEIGIDINPIEAGFKWACDFEKEFIGKEALLSIIEQGISRKLVGIEVFGGVAREGYEVATADGVIIGRCVAGMYCPTVKKYAANAFVNPNYAKIGTNLSVIIRGQPRSAEVIKRPFYVPVYRR